MSRRATKYVRKLKQTPDGNPLTRTAKLMLMVLADHHNEHANCAWPSMRMLAEEALCTTRRIEQLIPKLEASGIIKVERTLRADGSHETNRYFFVALKPLSELQKQGQNHSPSATQPTPHEGINQGGDPEILRARNFGIPPETGPEISSTPLIEQDLHEVEICSRQRESAHAHFPSHNSGINSGQDSQTHAGMEINTGTEFTLTEAQILALQAMNPYKPVAVSWSKFCFNCLSRNIRRTEKAWLDWFSREFELLEPVKAASRENRKPEATQKPTRCILCQETGGMREYLPGERQKPGWDVCDHPTEVTGNRPSSQTATATPATT